MTAVRQRLGMFGGAFDPPHNTHVALILAAIDQLELDEMRVFPTGDAWHKPRQLTSAVHRVAMAELAFSSIPRVVVDDRETYRTGPSYTVDTLRELKRDRPEADLFLIIGGDQARALDTWHEWQVIPQLAIICVAEREDSTWASSVFTPPDALKSRFLRLEMPPSAISASDIRARIATHKSVVPLVCEPVARYIDHHHLYQTV